MRAGKGGYAEINERAPSGAAQSKNHPPSTDVSPITLSHLDVPSRTAEVNLGEPHAREGSTPLPSRVSQLRGSPRFFAREIVRLEEKEEKWGKPRGGI
jgi:hypothetical protein